MPCWCIFATWIRRFVWNISSFAYMCFWLDLSFWWSFRVLFYFVWHLFVAVWIFASVNFRTSDFLFVCPSVISCDFSLKCHLKYRLTVKRFARNFGKFHVQFCSKIRENKEWNSSKFVGITFAQYCRYTLFKWWYLVEGDWKRTQAKFDTRTFLKLECSEKLTSQVYWDHKW